MKKLILVLVLLIPAAPAMAAKVYVDFDRNVDFTLYETYSLGDGTPAPNELNQKKIEAALHAHLEAEGLTLAENGDGDLVISTHAITEKSLKQKGGNVSLGVAKRGSRGSVGVSSGGGRRVKEVTEGTLVIDLVDGETGNLVWQAQASGTLKGDSSKLEQKLDKGMAQAFAKYPPE